MSLGIQTQVGAANVPAIAGDWASGNPRAFFDAGPGGLVAGLSGLTVGVFAWASSARVDGDGAPAIANNFGAGVPTGILHRQQQALITTFLADASMVVPSGIQVALCTAGDIWVKNDGATQALPGQKAYANLTTGKINFAATGAATAGATSSASTIAAATSSTTGSINNNVLTITAVGSGTVYPGTTISGTGVATGTKIVSQLTPLLSGEALGGIGRYAVSIPEQSVASTTISGTYGLLTVGGTVAGTFAVGQALAATGSVVAGTTITALGTGVGGAGTYVVDNNTVVASQAINVLAVNVETRWYAVSSGLAGELVKITSHPVG
jgi:hypothetical protein